MTVEGKLPSQKRPASMYIFVEKPASSLVNFSDYGALCRLEQALSEDKQKGLMRRFACLSPVQVEMLEAELQNQNRIPRPKDEQITVRHLLIREISAVRWKARRMAGRKIGMRCMVDLPRFLLSSAKRLLRTNPAFDIERIEAEGEHPIAPEAAVAYLEAVAAALLMLVRQPASDEKAGELRGSNLLLRILTKAPSKEHARADELMLVLPLDQRELTRLIKPRNSSKAARLNHFATGPSGVNQ